MDLRLGAAAEKMPRYKTPRHKRLFAIRRRASGVCMARPGIAGIPLRIFLPGLALGSALDLGLHFAIGFAGSSLLATIVQPSPILLVVLLAVLGLGAWLLIARRRHLTAATAAQAWAQATCPVCLALGSVATLSDERAVRLSRAV